MSKMADQWGPWIGWNGGECPVDARVIVSVCSFQGHEIARADALTWAHFPNNRANIIAYRVKREPVVHPVRQKAAMLHGIIRDGHWSKPAINGFLIFETRDGIPNMTTLRWEDA